MPLLFGFGSLVFGFGFPFFFPSGERSPRRVPLQPVSRQPVVHENGFGRKKIQRYDSSIGLPPRRHRHRHPLQGVQGVISVPLRPPSPPRPRKSEESCFSSEQHQHITTSTYHRKTHQHIALTNKIRRSSSRPRPRPSQREVQWSIAHRSRPGLFAVCLSCKTGVGRERRRRKSAVWKVCAGLRNAASPP